MAGDEEVDTKEVSFKINEHFLKRSLTNKSSKQLNL